MQSVYMVGLYLVILLGAIFLADAAVGFIRSARGTDDDAVGRRLSGAPEDVRLQPAGLLRASGGEWMERVPFAPWLSRMIAQSGLKTDVKRLLFIMGAMFVVELFVLAGLLPLGFAWIAVVLAAGLAVGPVVLFVTRKRAKRRRAFDEQLPDAIDLIVRSLRIGHPFGGALQVIARDMPSPIREEFAIACEQINYGADIPSTLLEMTRRVGASDLGYVAIAVQIQQESGGNLVEALSKLASVVRDRFRMFRKVNAITAEGRFSAWMLSIFPLVIAGMITLVRRNYYTQVMDFKYFPHLVVLVALMLIVNVVAMRILTTLKV